jgi:hypothetical protein
MSDDLLDLTELREPKKPPKFSKVFAEGEPGPLNANVNSSESPKLIVWKAIGWQPSGLSSPSTKAKAVPISMFAAYYCNAGVRSL